jgi:hypothetical protein
MHARYNWQTSRRKILLEELTVTQLVRESPAFYGTRRFIIVFTRAHQFRGLVSQTQSCPCPLFNWAPCHEGVLGEWRCNSKHSFASTLIRSEWTASRPDRFTPREWVPGTQWIGGWVGPRAGLDVVSKIKIPSPRRDSKPNHPIILPLVSRYTDWAINPRYKENVIMAASNFCSCYCCKVFTELSLSHFHRILFIWMRKVQFYLDYRVVAFLSLSKQLLEWSLNN